MRSLSLDEMLLIAILLFVVVMAIVMIHDIAVSIKGG